MTYTEPALPVLLLLGLAGVIRTWRRSSAGKRPWPEVIALAGIWFLSIDAGAWLLSRPLEQGYSQNATPTQTAEAIVVLSGTVGPPLPNRPYTIAGPDTYRRVQHAVWLYRNWKALPILVSGGESEGRPHSDTMRRILMVEGIPPESIWVEQRSGNTHEAALYGSAILRAQGVSRVVLIVEASSMPRAARSFEKAGITVVPAPVRFNHVSAQFSDFWPSWRAIAMNAETMHEIVGLAWYKLRGWI